MLDGGVRSGEFVDFPALSVSPNHSIEHRRFTVRKGNKGTIREDISRLSSESGIRASYRCIFRARRAKVAFWYVRLRQQGEVDYPLMGVVKVEVPTEDQR